MLLPFDKNFVSTYDDSTFSLYLQHCTTFPENTPMYKYLLLICLFSDLLCITCMVPYNAHKLLGLPMFAALSTHRHMMIKGKPCKILSISVSKTGKHGHAKCNFLAVDIFTGKKLEDMIPSSHGTTVPIVKRTDWEIIDIDEDDHVTLMDEGGNQKTDLNLPTVPEKMAHEIREAWAEGENVVAVSVQAAVGIEQIIAFKVVEG